MVLIGVYSLEDEVYNLFSRHGEIGCGKVFLHLL